MFVQAGNSRRSRIPPHTLTRTAPARIAGAVLFRGARVITINLDTDIARLTRRLDDLQRRQIPFATAAALTDVAKDAQTAVRKRMRLVFDDPTPFTLASTFVTPATKRRLESAVFFKDAIEAGKGVPAGKYLAAELTGGRRAHKRFEKALIAARVMPAGYYAVPGARMRLDAFGNVPRGTITKILSDLRAFAEVGFRANRATRAQAAERGRKFRASRYFVVQPGKSAQPGIYQRFDSLFGRGAVPAFIFVRDADYGRALDFPGVVNDTVARLFEDAFAARLQGALDSAR